MIGILIMGIVALVFAVILVNLYSFTESKNDEILDLLPGYNCGACGYAGCDELAKAIKEDPTLYKKCRVLRNDSLIKMKEYLKQQYGIEE